jgi:mono/diheme cytochrome c family protein
MPNQERHYDIKKLNRLFAIASVVLLVCIVAMFVADYQREWKDYQRDFRALEIEETRQKYREAAQQLTANEEYEKLRIDLARIQDEVDQKSDETEAVNREISRLQARHELAEQNYRFAKADYDAVKYEYETALTEGKDTVEALRDKLGSAQAGMEERRLKEESARDALNEQRRFADQYTDELKDLQKTERSLTTQVDILEKKLETIDPQKMTRANRIADSVRNLPILDLANPSYKVEQIVLKDLTDDVNFMRVPKVDRCITCHQGIADPDYADAPQPFRAHPNLELFLSSDSAHPMEEFGCTVCHDGRGRGTDFLSTAHTPSSQEQEKEWQEKYHWKRDHHWEAPMLPLPHVEASCFKCHSGQTVIKGAEKLNLGLNLIERAGCYGCHLIEKYKDWPKTGPDLTKLAQKTTKEWSYRWIRDPHSFRHNTWMPAFFGQSNISDPADSKRTDQEIHAIVHYLFAESRPFELFPVPVAGDAKRGEEIVAAYGCFGCHQIQPEKREEKTTLDTLRREHGPNLTGLGDKTTTEWIYNWLKDPQRHHPETRMPDLRLNDQEAADVAVYLSGDKNENFAEGDIPPIDESSLNEIVKHFLIRSYTTTQAETKLAEMATDEKLLYAGEKLIRHYGCFGCHEIDGFAKENPIGTELTEEGSKAVERLDFGFIHIDHIRQAWFTAKLKDPRVFDKDKVRPSYEKLRMPNYHFSDQEVEAIVTALLGFVDDVLPSSKIKPRTPENLFIEKGQKIVRQFNCQGCHVMEGEGGSIQPAVRQWLVDFEEKSETDAAALTTSFSPPDLIGEGQKVRAQWLFNFLHEPSTLRPWLKVRMPTFALNTAHLNVLVQYFNYLDGEEFPFNDPDGDKVSEEMVRAGEQLFSKDYFDCATCHIVGSQMPAGTPDRWAPDFALAKDRLKRDWVVKWLTNPQDLLPGTKMPTYFDPQYFDESGPEDILNGDERLQIKALRDYIMTLSGSNNQPSAHAAPAPVAEETPATASE